MYKGQYLGAPRPAVNTYILARTCTELNGNDEDMILVLASCQFCHSAFLFDSVDEFLDRIIIAVELVLGAGLVSQESDQHRQYF